MADGHIVEEADVAILRRVGSEPALGRNRLISAPNFHSAPRQAMAPRSVPLSDQAVVVVMVSAET